MSSDIKRFSPERERLHEVIFEADTKAGRNFDIILMIAILASVIVVMLESVPTYTEKYGTLFIVLEWIFTIFFTCLLYTSPSPRDLSTSRMPSSA